MYLSRGRNELPSEKRYSTFTGEVWGDSIIKLDNITVNSVFFTPKSRTYWHFHEEGQLLIITHGKGYVANRSGEVFIVRTGDQVFIPGGEIHWHGSKSDSFFSHIAISLKKTTWLEEVSDNEYNAVE